MGENSMNINSNLFISVFHFFSRKEKSIPEKSLKEIVIEEMDSLWTLVREQNEKEGYMPERECSQRIAESFTILRSKYTNEQLDDNYVWPRFVKVAVFNSMKPVDELVAYVDENNYIYLTNSLSALVRSVQKSEEERIIENVEFFAKTVYMHILEDINPVDIPSLLSLGSLSQKRGNFEEAREW